MVDQSTPVEPPRRYRWPWFVLGFFLLGVTLAVITVRREAQRVKEQRAPWLQESSRSNTNAPQ
jgi:F0F1-type ATP synthase assembly protein I